MFGSVGSVLEPFSPVQTCARALVLFHQRCCLSSLKTTEAAKKKTRAAEADPAHVGQTQAQEKSTRRAVTESEVAAAVAASKVVPAGQKSSEDEDDDDVVIEPRLQTAAAKEKEKEKGKEEEEEEEKEQEEEEVDSGGHLEKLLRGFQRLEKTFGQRLDAVEKQISNIPLQIQQDVKNFVPSASIEAEVFVLPEWLTAKELIDAAQELGFWTKSGTRFAFGEQDEYITKILTVLLESDAVTDDDKAPFLGDDHEIDSEKVKTLASKVRVWDSKQKKTLGKYYKGSRGKRTVAMVEIGAKDVAYSRYYNIFIAEAESEEEEADLRKKMAAANRHNNPNMLSLQGQKELYVFCSKMGQRFKLTFEEWKDMINLAPANKRKQQVVFEDYLQEMRESAIYKEMCIKLNIHPVNDEKLK